MPKFKVGDEDVFQMKPYNTRLAPSPTGTAHIGTLRTGLFNYLVARQSGGKFILRIDDTDCARNDESTIQPIYDGLKWLGIDYDYTFRQSSRTAVYKDAACGLLKEGYAIKLDNGAVALKWHPEMPRKWTDNIAGEVPITDTNIEQIDGRTILLKGDEHGNSPVYQFTSAYDDWDTGVNYIIRGTDHITNTAKQLCIWWALNKCVESKEIYASPVEFPEFAHIGLIFHNGRKLSKRDGASSILYYRDQGYTPEALFAFLLRLGWNPKEDAKDSYTLSYEQAIQQFLTNGRMRNTNAQMDLSKLDAVQRKLNNKQKLAA